MKKNIYVLWILLFCSLSAQSQWLYWGSEDYGNFQGASFGSPIDFAQRFEPADLSDYEGKSITKMRFHPGVIENSVEYTLKIWEADPGGTPVEVYAQIVPSVTFEQMNTVDLNTPWLIDVSKELWIGITVGNGGFMGYDNVPAVVGKGNKMGMAGDWYDWGDHNYMIHAFAEATDDNGDDNGDEIILLADFEDGTFQGFDETGWGTSPDTEIIDNPLPGGINTSNKVLYWSDENPWGGTWRWDPGVFSPEYDKLLVDVMIPADAEWGGTNQWLRLDGNNSASGVPNWEAAVAVVTERDEWVTIEFDLSSMPVHDYQILFLLSSFDQYYADNFRWVIGEDVVLDPVTLTLLADPEEGGIPIGGGVYDPGESVFIQLIVNPGYQFVKWEKDGAHHSWFMNFSYTIPDEDVTLTAILNQVYALELEVSPAGTGTVSGAGNYAAGALVSVSAQANPGFSFVNWTDADNVEVSDAAAFTYTMPANAVTLSANFEELEPVIISEFPWTEDFEDALFPPEGWLNINVSGFQSWERSAAVGGGFAAYHTYDVNEDTWLITPGIEVPETGEFELSFRHLTVYADWYPGEGSNSVWISTGSANPADSEFVQVWSPATVLESTWENVELSIDGYAGETIFIAFRYFADYTHEWYVDDVTVEEVVAELDTYILTLLANPEDGGTVDGAGEFEAGAMVPVSAIAEDGFEFVNWTINGGRTAALEVAGAGTTEANGIYNQDGEVNGKPKYVKGLFEIYFQTGGWLLVDKTVGEEFLYFIQVDSSTPPQDGWQVFNGTPPAPTVTPVGGGDNDNVVSDQASFDFEMPAENVTLTANFEATEPAIYTLTLLADPETGGIPIGAGDYEAGESVFIQLIVNEGYQFVNWEKDDEHFSWIRDFSYTMPAEDVTLTAILNEVFALELEVSPEGTGTVSGAGNYAEGAQVSLSAQANPGFSFVNWTDADDLEVSDEAAFTYTMPANAVTLTANFEELEPVIISDFPWTEDFEDALFPPEGWLNINVSGFQSWERSAAVGGGFAAYHTYDVNEDTWLITPGIEVPETGDFELSFRHFTVYADYYPGEGANSVWISTGSANPADDDFVQVWSPTTVLESTWENVELSLDGYAGETIFIAFRYFADYTHEWYVDDVTVQDIDEGEEPAGTSCENPYIVNLPLVNFESTTSDKGNNYSSNSILPPSFYINGNDMVLQFTVTETGLLTGDMTANDSFIGVFIMADCPNTDNPAVMNAWSTSYGNTLTLPSSNPNQPQEILLTPGDYFLIVSSYPPPQSIDFTLNLEINPLGECTAPVILTATNQTQNSADLGWTPTGTEDAWNIIYGLPGFDVETEGTLVENVTANPYTLGDLDPGTSYEFYVQAVCDGGLTSDWAGPKSFITECDIIISESFVEGFESETAPPECWAVWYANPTPPEENLIIHSSEHAFSGSRSLRFSSEVSASPINQFLRTPELGFDTDVLVSFYYRTGLSASVFTVGTSVNGTDWVWSDDVNADNVTWEQFSMVASADVKYVAIEFKGPYFRTLFIDDFAITPLYTVDYSVVEVEGQTNGTVAAAVNGEPITSGDVVTEGANVILTAQPDAGYVVKEWTLNGTVIITDNTFHVNSVSSDVTVTVEFEEVPFYTLSLVADPADGGTLTGDGEYSEGEQVEITADAEDGYGFVNWTDAANNVVSTDASFTYTMPAEDVTLTANFEMLQFELMLIPDPITGGEVSGGGLYTAGEQITVTATANDGYEFTGWYDVFDNHVSDDAQFVFTMPASDIALVAYFEEIPVVTYTLSLEVDPVDAGTVTGAGEYEEGEQVNLNVTPAQGYFFVNWTDSDDQQVSEEASFTFTMPGNDVTLIANFELENSVAEIGQTVINIFPNPATSNFNIVADETINKVTIFDITGKVVFTEFVNNTKLNVNESFERGTYLVRIYTESGISVRQLQIR